ncbi:hypothetical protein [Gillisia hiemivivida]|uniref:Uncharacterized protein n=1 Tax=Gillisia hiemivivida TaxID=291190 RepID=A0A5C6ZYK7_9FLAO|nr:hypothetical protein [Gillisia hiemivivida]TXD95828.1 hypothetical protein ES724_02040 [Gillisia hiemivivida]
MRSKSIKGKSTAEIETALVQSMSDGFKPSLAIVFCSKSLDINTLRALPDSKIIKIFGANTNGEFRDEETEKGTADILLLDMKKEYFQLYFEEYPSKNYPEVATHYDI